jgi:ABC-2 type transport system permease protein
LPIHDQGYRRYAGTRAPLGRAWAVIAMAGIRTLLARRAFIGLLLLSWIPFIVRCVQIYAATNVPQAATMFGVDARMFRQFLEQQQTFLFFITVYAGAGLIANDRRVNALQIYLSKPLTRLEYVCGKLAILVAFLLFVTFVPAMLLLVVQVMFSGSVAFLLDNIFLVPAITLFSGLQVAAVAVVMLALSSLSRSSRYVGVLYAGLIFFSEAIYGILYGLTRDSRLAFVSMRRNLAQIGDFIFRLPPQFQMPVALAFVAVALLIAASVLILKRRVRGVEVVA